MNFFELNLVCCAITKRETGLGAGLGLGPGFVHAEEAAKLSPADKGVFYTRVRGSATESAAALDVCRKLKLVYGANR